MLVSCDLTGQLNGRYILNVTQILHYGCKGRVAFKIIRLRKIHVYARSVRIEKQISN